MDWGRHISASCVARRGNGLRVSGVWLLSMWLDPVPDNVDSVVEYGYVATQPASSIKGGVEQLIIGG